MWNRFVIAHATPPGNDTKPRAAIEDQWFESEETTQWPMEPRIEVAAAPAPPVDSAAAENNMVVEEQDPPEEEEDEDLIET